MCLKYPGEIGQILCSIQCRRFGLNEEYENCGLMCSNDTQTLNDNWACGVLLEIISLLLANLRLFMWKNRREFIVD